MGKSITLIRTEQREDGAVYRAEGAALSAVLGAMCVIGPGMTEDSLRILDAVGWRKFYELNRKLSIEDNMALRKLLAPASKLDLTGDELIVPPMLLKRASLPERCVLVREDQGLWSLRGETAGN